MAIRMPDAERGALAGVLEQDRPDRRVAERGDPVVGLGVGDVEDDDDLGRVLGAPVAQAAHQDVGILVVRRHDHRGGGREVVDDRAWPARTGCSGRATAPRRSGPATASGKAARAQSGSIVDRSKSLSQSNMCIPR